MIDFGAKLDKLATLFGKYRLPVLCVTGGYIAGLLTTSIW